MKYREYSFRDFVEDAYFREWVYQPNEKNHHFWRNWLNQHPKKQAEVDQARLILLSVQFKQYSVSTEEESDIWNKINQERYTAGKYRIISPVNYKHPRKIRLKWAAGIAASIAVLLLVYIGWGRSEKIEYTAEYGTTRTIILPDQSIVELNANSTLQLEPHWVLQREVWLQGEAFFEIKPQENLSGERIPFLVHTDELTIEVVGTEFNVLSRRGETQVGLRSGKVKLALDTEDNSDISMQPGDWIAFSQENKQLKKNQVAPYSYTAWRDHRFLFSGHTLSEIKIMLEDYYGYQVSLLDSRLAERTFSGQFPADRLDLLLEAIQATLEVRIKKTGTEILILEK